MSYKDTEGSLNGIMYDGYHIETNEGARTITVTFRRDKYLGENVTVFHVHKIGPLGDPVVLPEHVLDLVKNIARFM